MTPSDDDERCLTAREVCGLLKVSRETLRKWRDRGGGPPYFRIGSRGDLRYRVADLRRWSASQSTTSTTHEALK